MDIVKLITQGDWNQTFEWFSKMLMGEEYMRLDALASIGTEALAASTPQDTGVTSNSWHHDISRNNNTTTITWMNDSFSKNGLPIAILLQYDHGTGTGGFVRGVDYINPAIMPVFEEIENAVWEEVIR